VQSGVKFTIPGEDDMLALKKAMEPLYQELGPKEQDIVQRIGDT